MAMPILFNFRAVQKESSSVFLFALTNFSLDDSGILFELEYDDKHQHPWGITIKQVKGQPFGYLNNLPNEKLQILSSAMSTYLNSCLGFTEDGDAIHVPLSDVLDLSETVLTLSSSSEQDVEFIPVIDQQKKLVDALNELEFFKSGSPDFVLNPPALVDNTLTSSSH